MHQRQRIARSQVPDVTAFTLIEMLAVLVIMIIVLAVAVPALKNFAIGKGVDAGARELGAQFRLARQEAVVRRKRIAVVLPRGELGREVGYTASRQCVVDSSNRFVEWVEDTRWEQLPPGAIIAEADVDAGIDTPLSDTSPTLIDDVPAPGSPATLVDDVRAVVFRPSGRLTTSLPVYVTVIDGIKVPDGLRIRNRDNYTDLVLDMYTGRVTFKTP